jgi:glycosyltransferase involved in cell wall biosynthesis
MRILLLHERYRDGDASGENRVVDAESEWLTRHGHEVAVFGCDNRELDGIGAVAQARLAVDLISSLRWKRRVRDEIRRFRPDVVHVHNIFPMMSPSVIAACVDEKVASVATMHNYRTVCAAQNLMRDGNVCTDCFGTRSAAAIKHRCHEGSLLKTLPMVAHVEYNWRRWTRQLDLCFALSPGMREIFVQAGYPADQVVVKGNAVVDASLPPASERNEVLYLARLAESKGIRFLMRAWEQVAGLAEASGVRLTIAGNGELEAEVVEWVQRTPSAVYVGTLNRDECWETLARSRAVVCPSVWPEPFGLAAVEAMCARSLPIAPNNGAFPDLIESGVDGLLYQQGDVGALADQLRHVIGHPDQAAEIGRAGRKRYERDWSPQANVSRLEELYAAAIARHQRRAASQ